MYDNIITKAAALIDGAEQLQTMIDGEIVKLHSGPLSKKVPPGRQMLFQAMQEAASLAIDARNNLLRVRFNVAGTAGVLDEWKEERLE